MKIMKLPPFLLTNPEKLFISKANYGIVFNAQCSLFPPLSDFMQAHYYYAHGTQWSMCSITSSKGTVPLFVSCSGKCQGHTLLRREGQLLLPCLYHSSLVELLCKNQHDDKKLIACILMIYGSMYFIYSTNMRAYWQRERVVESPRHLIHVVWQLVKSS